MLIRKRANECFQMLPYSIGKHEPKQKNIDFEPAREISSKEVDKMVVKRRFERLYVFMEVNSYTIYEELREDKGMFNYGFKHIKTNKVDSYIRVRCESDEFCETDKLFNFSTNKYINEEIEMRSFKITEWSFMTLVKRNNFFKSQSICS